MTAPTRQLELGRIGESAKRADAVPKTTGEFAYSSDLYATGMLWGHTLRSPHAHARIVEVDLSDALTVPGVHAVLTGQELDYKIGLYIVDKDVLAKDVVRHFGEAVAAVAAESPEIAAEAVELIEVRYEVLTPVLDPMEAFGPDAPLVHPELGSYGYVEAAFSPQPGTNVAHVQKIRKGDVEKGFAEAEWVIEREYTNPSVQHVPLETHVAIVQWKAGDQVTIEFPDQETRSFIAEFVEPVNR